MKNLFTSLQSSDRAKSLFEKRSAADYVKMDSYAFPKQAYMIAAIDPGWLKQSGIKGVILDLDNTLVSEDDCYLSPNAEDWIKQVKSQGVQFFILSNSQRRDRVKFWSERLNIPAISPARKPFPSGFRHALTRMQLQPSQVVVIGDSRHTDMLGAWLVGCLSIQVATLPHPFRWWERLLGKQVQIPYPAESELWSAPLLQETIVPALMQQGQNAN